jgi:serine/threonine protein phosphatase PrpC
MMVIMKYPQLYDSLYKWFMRKTLKSGARRVADLPCFIGSDIGAVREQNQDRVAVMRVDTNTPDGFAVIVLCDGMGGMADGESCASQTIAAFLSSCIENAAMPTTPRLNLAAREANQIVLSQHHQKGGSTLSALLIDNMGQTTGVNVGDSRIYAFMNRTLTQLSVDDTIAGQLGLERALTEQSKELVQFIGVGTELEPHVFSVDTKNNMVCLTTDGLHIIGKPMMQMLLQATNEAGVAAKRMIDVSKWCGGFDNMSVAIVSPALLHLESSSDTGTIEIWDPFGDLQIVTLLDSIKENPSRLVLAHQKESFTTIKKRTNSKATREKKKDSKPQISVDQMVIKGADCPSKLLISFDGINKGADKND